jgi:GTP-binding protein Era
MTRTSNEPVEFKAGLVSLVGETNVGKSTLVNRLVGQKVSIISPKPQTTRHRIRGIVHRESSQIVLLDTPGLHNPRTTLNRQMVKVALQALHGADLILMLVFPNPVAAQPQAERLLNAIRKVVHLPADGGPARPPVILAINKIDTVSKPRLLPLIEEMSQRFPFSEIIPISARTGENLDRLLELLEKYLPASPPLFDPELLSDRSERFFIAELIREVVLFKTQQEVPHAATVIVEHLEVDDENQRMHIHAIIAVERQGQKKILLGKAGRLIKEIGTRARREIETIFPYHVRLDLWVKVVPNWRNRAELIRRFGLEEL